MGPPELFPLLKIQKISIKKKRNIEIWVHALINNINDLNCPHSPQFLPVVSGAVADGGERVRAFSQKEE